MQIQTVAQQIADAFGLKNSPMLIQMINMGTSVSVLEFCARTGGNMKYLLIKRSCGFDVIRAVIDLTLGLKPHVELSMPENKHIVNDFIYCYPGVFDHLEGFDELVEQGVLSDYRLLRPQGFNRIYRTPPFPITFRDLGVRFIRCDIDNMSLIQ